MTVLVKDEDGHTYAIEDSEAERFHELIMNIRYSKMLSDEWYDANAALDNEFREKMFG